MQPQFPWEILDHIFSFLQDDHPSLRCCAEVNTVLSDLVERHLYRQLTLINFERFTKKRWIDGLMPDQVTKLFRATPRLASHVRVLRIMFARTETIRWTGKHMNDDAIGKILPLLSQVTTIGLYGFPRGQMSWYSFHKVFQQSFTQILNQPSVVDITICGIKEFPLPLLDHCISLKSLSLHTTNYPVSNISDLSIEYLSNHKRVQLISLEIEECSPYLPTILAWLRPPYSPQIQPLSSLRLTVDQPEDVHSLQALLDDCSSHLKKLSLFADEVARTTYNMAHEVIFPPINVPHGVPNFSGIRSLKALLISGQITSIKPTSNGGQDQTEDPVFNTCIPWFIQALKTFGSSGRPNSLEHIILDITFLIDKHSLTKVDWQPLIAILSSRYFSALRRVELRAKHDEDSTIDLQILVSMLHSDVHLSPLIQSGLLSVIGQSRKTAPAGSW